tara:strand:+ start:671 stop:940 length:270 start_codon:yes stop_codon:yes gene_type:complete
MTKIYVYCLFDRQDTFHGAYSSLKAVHRDALKIANKGNSEVVMEAPFANKTDKASLVGLRNVFKGKYGVQVYYRCGTNAAKIIKMKLKE